MSPLAKIERLRAEIAAGTYETPEKLEAAIEAFLDRHWRAGGAADAPASEEESTPPDGQKAES